MDEGESITIKVDGTLENDNKPKNPMAGQPKNGTNEIVDLTDIDTPDEISTIKVAAVPENHTNAAAVITNGASNVPRTVIDLVPIAKHMWEFSGCQPNRELITYYAHLPKPIHHTVNKTTIEQFRRRLALPNETNKYTPRAQSYINLLTKHNRKLVEDIFQLVALKCAYCAIQPKHIPGSCSFIRITDTEDLRRLFGDALHQRLLYLRNTCHFSRREYGDEVFTMFDNKYDRKDSSLIAFVDTWLRELQIITKRRRVEEREMLRPQALDDRTSAYRNNGHHQPTTHARAGPRAPEQRQRAFANHQHALLHPPVPNYPLPFTPMYNTPIYSNLNPHERFLRLHQQDRNILAREQQLLRDNKSYRQMTAGQMAANQINQQSTTEEIHRKHQHQQLLNLHKEQQERQHQYQQQLNLQKLRRETQQQQQLMHQQKLMNLQKQLQEKQRQQQQQQQKQQQRSRPRLPDYIPRNRRIPFEDLQKVYETNWEDTTMSVFNCPYDSDDDNDETDDYFRSFHNNTNETENGGDEVEIIENMSSYKMSLPPLPTTRQKNLDYYIPIQSHELARCPDGVPYLKDEPIPEKTRTGRPRKSVPIDVTLSDVSSHDVVMACEDCPTSLAKALHDLPGNCCFLRWVSNQRPGYANALSDEERLAIVEAIIKKVASRKGFFLKATVTKKNNSRTWRTTDKEVQDYVRFRLVHAFPDILDNSQIGLRIFRCKSPRTSSQFSKGLPGLAAAATTTSAVGPSSKKDTAGAAPELTSIVDLPSLPSKVFEVEYAPKVGLMDGLLGWDNNNGPNNPKIKFSTLKTLPPRKTEEPSAITATDLINHEQSALNENEKNGQNTSENVNESQTESDTMSTLLEKDDTHSGEILTAIAKKKRQEESSANQQCNDIDGKPIEKRQDPMNSPKRNGPGSTVCMDVIIVNEEKAEIESSVVQQFSAAKESRKKKQKPRESTEHNSLECTTSEDSESSSAKRPRIEVDPKGPSFNIE